MAALRSRPDPYKTTGYSLFLQVLLPFRSFTLVIGVQHLLGLGIAVMIYLLAGRAGVPKRWAAVATLPVPLDGFEIEDEHMLMAEALFSLLVMLALLAVLWRYRVPWPVALAAGAGRLRGRRAQRGLALPVPFPLFMLWRGWRSWRGWLVTAAMAIGCAAPVLAYAGWFHHWNGQYKLTRPGGFYL